MNLEASLGAGNGADMNSMLMQMLKTKSGLPKSEDKGVPTHADTSSPTLGESEGAGKRREHPTKEIEPSDIVPLEIRYDPQFLIMLEDSPLVQKPTFWASELPPMEFFRLNITNESKKGRRNSRNRRGSAAAEDISDRKAQRARQKENKKRGSKKDKKTDELGGSEAASRRKSAHALDWMLEEEEEEEMSTGNDILDFELWRLKMRIETSKRNGEEVNSDDLLEYKNLLERAKTSSSVKDATSSDQSAFVSAEKESLPNIDTVPKKEEKHHRTVDDQFSMSVNSMSLNEKSSDENHSQFSSFFDSPKPRPSDPVEQRPSRLMSIMEDSANSRSSSSNSTNIAPTTNTNAQMLPQQVNPHIPLQPFQQPLLNQLPQDKNQLFLQSLMMRNQSPSHQHHSLHQQPSFNPQHQGSVSQQGRSPLPAFNKMNLPPHMNNGGPPPMNLPLGMPMMNGMNSPNGVNMNHFMMQQLNGNFPQNMSPNLNQFHPGLYSPQQAVQTGGKTAPQPQYSSPQQVEQHQHQHQQHHHQQQQQHRSLHPQQQQQQQQQHYQHHNHQQQHLNQHPQQQQQQPSTSYPQHIQQHNQHSPNNLPYGSHQVPSSDMPPNHPLMMLLKNKRKSTNI